MFVDCENRCSQLHRDSKDYFIQVPHSAGLYLAISTPPDANNT